MEVINVLIFTGGGREKRLKPKGREENNLLSPAQHTLSLVSEQ